MQKPKRGERIVLDVHELDGRGNGLARVGEYTVAVRGALPGDRIEARVRRVQNRRRRAEARVEGLVSEGVPRVVPRCSHFKVCGGCLWQDVPYEAQVQLKTDMVTTCLREVGIEVVLDEPLVSPELYYYRNKMEFSFGLSPEGELELGLHMPGRFDRVFDMEACYLQSEQSNQILDRVRRFARAHAHSVYHLKRHEGLLRFLTIREGKQTGETMVILTTSGEPFPEALELGKMLEDEFPQVRSVVQSINQRKAQVAIGDEEKLLAGTSTVREELDGYQFEISPASFFQTNTFQAQRLYRRVVELAELTEDERVLDVYCGAGGISLFLARQAREVVGVEVVEAAVRDAARNSANNGVQNCQFVAGAAEDLLRQFRAQGEQFDVMVTDPPRPGMHPKALAAACELQPGRIVYVSCNPQALAQDLQQFIAAGYVVDYLQLVDMFPHTPHCEILARLRRADIVPEN
ncbi:MAG: 23S rRNA (uracil(1939)-C(5))-methyltransferase RlmD [bacterium]|nr:23S rRNA (uracil(1939)-C(5))-methyltransferase RlmD [bacterium]